MRRLADCAAEEGRGRRRKAGEGGGRRRRARCAARATIGRGRGAAATSRARRGRRRRRGRRGRRAWRAWRARRTAALQQSVHSSSGSVPSLEPRPSARRQTLKMIEEHMSHTRHWPGTSGVMSHRGAPSSASASSAPETSAPESAAGSADPSVEEERPAGNGNAGGRGMVGAAARIAPGGGGGGRGTTYDGGALCSASCSAARRKRTSGAMHCRMYCAASMLGACLPTILRSVASGGAVSPAAKNERSSGRVSRLSRRPPLDRLASREAEEERSRCLVRLGGRGLSPEASTFSTAVITACRCIPNLRAHVVGGGGRGGVRWGAVRWREAAEG